MSLSNCWLIFKTSLFDFLIILDLSSACRGRWTGVDSGFSNASVSSSEFSCKVSEKSVKKMSKKGRWTGLDSGFSLFENLSWCWFKIFSFGGGWLQPESQVVRIDTVATLHWQGDDKEHRGEHPSEVHGRMKEHLGKEDFYGTTHEGGSETEPPTLKTWVETR